MLKIYLSYRHMWIFFFFFFFLSSTFFSENSGFNSLESLAILTLFENLILPSHAILKKVYEARVWDLFFTAEAIWQFLFQFVIL